MGLVFSFPFFSQYYPELFPPCNITVMCKQSGTLKFTCPKYCMNAKPKWSPYSFAIIPHGNVYATLPERKFFCHPWPVWIFTATTLAV